ncbi:MAG: hypothetical protein Q8R17_03065 [bacterium]|nr:hypothetical protein [bacterium]
MKWFSLGMHGKKFLIIDIASDSVGVGVVAVFPNAKPTLLFTLRAPIALAPRLEPKHFFSATLHALTALCARLFQTHRTDLAGTVCAHIFLHAPWVVSKTRSVRVDFPEITKLTPDTIASVIQETEKGITENFNNAHREVAESVRVVEKKIIEFRVNGYTVASAVGKEARTLELTLLESFAPENAITRFGNALDSLSHSPREWHGAAAACAGALSASAHGQGDVLTVCAGSEATEACIERNNLLQEVISIPFGIRTAARAAWNDDAFSSTSSAESFLRAASFTSLTEQRRATVEHARAIAGERFRRALAAALLPKIKAGFAPARATLLADEHTLPFFDAVFRLPFFDAGETALNMAFSVFGAGAFANSIQFARAATPDTYLSGESAFVALYENEKKM